MEMNKCTYNMIIILVGSLVGKSINPSNFKGHSSAGFDSQQKVLEHFGAKSTVMFNGI